MRGAEKDFAALLLIAATACSPAPQPVTPPRESLSGEGWIDATALLDPATTPVYTGNAPMHFTFDSDMRKGAGYTLSTFNLGAHSGTHVDAPMHFIVDGAPIDKVSLAALIGPARVIDIADSVQVIDTTELSRHLLQGATRILFRTRSSHHDWMDSSTFHTDFAYLTADAAAALVRAGVVLVGVDYLSAEKYGAAEPLAHRALLGKNIPIVEGLQLKEVPAGDYDLVVLPLRVANHEAAPARALLHPRAP